MILVAVTIGRLYVTSTPTRAQQHRCAASTATNSPTRDGLLDRAADVLEDTWRSEHHAATLIQINIDRFKNINDTLGHDVVNRVLVSLAERLRATADGFGASVAAPVATTSWCSTARRARSTMPASVPTESAVSSRARSSSATRPCS